jgi:formylglycine-generating enzyme required for sulfatase activity
MQDKRERRAIRSVTVRCLEALWLGGVALSQARCGASSIILDPSSARGDGGAADVQADRVAIDSGAPADSGTVCGARHEACCAGGACSEPTTQCDAMSNRCVPCGGGGQRCCAAGACSTGACVAGVCPRPSCPSATDPSCRIVELPGGTFTVAENVPGSQQPNITVSPFAMDATEVTVARFRRYYPDRSRVPAPPPAQVRYPGGWYPTAPDLLSSMWPSDPTWMAPPGSGESLPIRFVEVDVAIGFCIWDGGRLPTEAEFEWAAYGTTHDGRPAPRLYPWGSTPPSAACDLAQWNDCLGDLGTPVRRVASFAPTGGLYDLAGNVGELVADSLTTFSDPRCWGGVPRTNPICLLPGVPTTRAIVERGGDYGNTNPAPQLPSALFRRQGSSRGTGSSTSPSTGFRCVYDR